MSKKRKKPKHYGFTLVHSHKHGDDSYRIVSDVDLENPKVAAKLAQDCSEEVDAMEQESAPGWLMNLCRLLGIDFEPDREELILTEDDENPVFIRHEMLLTKSSKLSDAGEPEPVAKSKADQLAEEYGHSSHEIYGLSDWHEAVTQNDTIKGYWEWVAERLEDDVEPQ